MLFAHVLASVVMHVCHERASMCVRTQMCRVAESFVYDSSGVLGCVLM